MQAKSSCSPGQCETDKMMLNTQRAERGSLWVLLVPVLLAAAGELWGSCVPDLWGFVFQIPDVLVQTQTIRGRSRSVDHRGSSESGQKVQDWFKAVGAHFSTSHCPLAQVRGVICTWPKERGAEQGVVLAVAQPVASRS